LDQNNYVELCRMHLSVDDKAATNFNILAISLSVLHNYINNSNKLFSNLKLNFYI